MSLSKPLPIRFLQVSVLLIYLLMFIPIIIIIITSFTTQPYPTLPEGTVTLRWFSSLFANDRLIDSVINSILIASAVAVLSGIIGTAAAFGFVRGEFPTKGFWSLVILLPMMISPIITGIAILIFLTEFLGIRNGFIRIIIAHTSLVLPFVFLFVRAELSSFDETLEDASRTLGANKAETGLYITLPVISTSIISGLFIAFAVSFGEFVATQFLATAESETAPIVIYTMLRTNLTPEISALSTLLVVILLMLAIGSQKLS